MMSSSFPYVYKTLEHSPTAEARRDLCYWAIGRRLHFLYAGEVYGAGDRVLLSGHERQEGRVHDVPRQAAGLCRALW